jgi:ubiquinone/menaquinone biosynthesis C-methylase UbiE
MSRVTQILRDELKTGKLILDAGVGTGRFTEPLQRVGLYVVGVDISNRMMQKSIEKGLKNLMFADVCTLPFGDKAFDFSISVHLLHLVSDWRKALREIVRVTRESLFSVLVEDHDKHESTPRRLYEEVLKKYGFEYHHPGLGEWDLRKIVKTTRSIFADSYEVRTDEDIAYLNDKVFSSQWKLQDDLHEKAMQEVRRAFSSPKTYLNRVYVHRWDIDTIGSYLERSKPTKQD